MNMNCEQDHKPIIFRVSQGSQGSQGSQKNKDTQENRSKVHDVNGVLKTMSKLDNETENFHVNRVSSTLKQRILKGRTDKKMTQSQLAQAINEKPQIIQQYESGKAVPSPQILNKLSRVLGVQLNTKI